MGWGLVCGSRGGGDEKEKDTFGGNGSGVFGGGA